MTALLITKTSRNNHTLYTKMYNNGGSLTNTIINKTKIYALRDGALIGIHTPWTHSFHWLFDPHQGVQGGTSSMYNTPQYLLTEIQFNAQTLFRRPINVCQSSSLAPTCNRERIGEMKMRKSYVEWWGSRNKRWFLYYQVWWQPLRLL